jgi:glycogen debranching enzyme
VIEVQGYVFSALRAMSSLAERRGDKDAAGRWKERAEKIRHAVEKKFWMEDLGFYGIAIDGAGDLCRVKASNVGHLLYAGIPSQERAGKVHNLFLSPMFDTGWGIRTLAPHQARFNPMSYHNGSVWPHDTAFCAAGLARYGEREGVMRLINEMFETAVRFDMRLPELFCGFPRASGEGPIAYPVACLPQAWAAGSLFMMMQACLGLSVDGWKGEIYIDRPHLPTGLDNLRIHGLAVGGESLNIVFQRVGERVAAFFEERPSTKIQLHIRA